MKSLKDVNSNFDAISSMAVLFEWTTHSASAISKFLKTVTVDGEGRLSSTTMISGGAVPAGEEPYGEGEILEIATNYFSAIEENISTIKEYLKKLA